MEIEVLQKRLICKINMLKKQFCVNGHDTYITGREKDGHCKICHTIQKNIWKLNSKKYLKNWYKNYYILNKEELDKRQKDDRNMNKPKFSDRSLRSRYKLTLNDYNQILANQEYRCLGCLRHISEFDKAFPIDHDHNCCQKQTTCGKCIRGLLCDNCNRILGQSKDLSSTLRRLADYLDKWNSKIDKNIKETIK